MFVTCHLTAAYVNLTLMDEVWANVSSPYRIVLNLMRNEFNITTDLVVLMSNWFYRDFFSMSFWIGDIVYQIVVIQPVAFDVTEDTSEYHN